MRLGYFSAQKPFETIHRWTAYGVFDSLRVHFLFGSLQPFQSYIVGPAPQYSAAMYHKHSAKGRQLSFSEDVILRVTVKPSS